MDLFLLQTVLGLSCVCRACKLGNLILRENFAKKMGLASLLVLEYDTCSKVTEIYSSTTCKDSSAFEINRRAVLGFLEICCGKAALNAFCSMLNMPMPMTDEVYTDSLKSVKDVLEAEATESMKKAALEEKSQKSKQVLMGHGENMAFLPFKVLSLQFQLKLENALTMKSAKQKWLAGHSCSINYAGPAPAMEPEGVKRIFERSESERSLQYTGHIGDGDSKSYSYILKVNPYNGKLIKKYECVGHVHKWLGTSL